MPPLKKTTNDEHPDNYNFEKSSYIKLLTDYEIVTLFPVGIIREMKEKRNCIEVYVDFNIEPQRFPVTKSNYSEYQRFIFFYSLHQK